MKREEFAKRIMWSKSMFWLGLLNPLAYIPQIWSILSTHVVDGISIPMFGLFFVIQVSFCLNGFFHRDKNAMISMGSGAMLSMVAIVLTAYYRI